jgi:hypothetical protein
MNQDKNMSEKLEAEASDLLDEVDPDEAKLDRVAYILADAEKLKGSIFKVEAKDKSLE